MTCSNQPAAGTASGDYLQADETRLQVLKERGKAPQSESGCG